VIRSGAPVREVEEPRMPGPPPKPWVSGPEMNLPGALPDGVTGPPHKQRAIILRLGKLTNQMLKRRYLTPHFGENRALI